MAVATLIVCRWIGQPSTTETDQQGAEVVAAGQLRDSDAPPAPLHPAELAARLPAVSATESALERSADREAAGANPDSTRGGAAAAHLDYRRLRDEWNAMRGAHRDRQTDPASRLAETDRWRERNRASLDAVRDAFGFEFPEGDPAALHPRFRLPDAPLPGGLPASTGAPGAARPEISAFLHDRRRIAGERAALDETSADLPAAERVAVLERWEAENAERLRHHRGIAAQLDLPNYEQLPRP